MRTSTLMLSASMLTAAAMGCTASETPDGNMNTVTSGIGAQPIAGTMAIAGQSGGAGAGVVSPMGTAGTSGAAGTGVSPMGSAGMGGGAGAGGGGGAGGADDGTDTDFPDPRGCPGLDSGFPGDEACLPPPAAGEGFQIHVGPTDYTDMAQINRFTFAPGMETSQCWSFHTPNTEDVYYQTFVLSGRPGTHHIINTMYKTDFANGTTFTGCMDGGTGQNSNILANLPGASKAYMPRKRIAPENASLGRMIPANTASQADMHYFNFTQEPILREFWMNIYTVPMAQVQMQSNQIRGMGGISWSLAPIPPGTDMVYKYSCPIMQPGRIIALLGHYHAHGKRFTAFLRRQGGAPEKVFEMYDYNDPQIFAYDSITTNPMFSTNAAGAISGQIDVMPGDILDWECHIHNVEPDGSPGPSLRYVNEVRTGEMCNLWGESVGPLINCVLP